MDNLDDFLGASPDGEAAPVAEVTPAEPVAAEPAETEEQKATRERDERGRFKAKEAEEPVMVPLKALHETRDEVKALKAQLESLRQPQPEVPDMFADPEGYQAHQRSELQNAILNERLNLSEELAVDKHGEEAVEQAKQWGLAAFQANPALYQSFISQRNPYGFLVNEYRKQSMLSQLDPKEFDAFLAWKEAQKAPAAPVAAPPVPDTLADAQSARGSPEAYRVPSLDEILKR